MVASALRRPECLLALCLLKRQASIGACNAAAHAYTWMHMHAPAWLNCNSFRARTPPFLHARASRTMSAQARTCLLHAIIQACMHGLLKVNEVGCIAEWLASYIWFKEGTSIAFFIVKVFVQCTQILFTHDKRTAYLGVWLSCYKFVYMGESVDEVICCK